tara:strand:- start:983 stop:1396 length:414 start_codon:yes stop_codon:yes gene_type:complete
MKMFFKDRKRVIMDRGPSWPDYDKAEPFMIRYYPLFRKRPKWFPFNIFIHKILKSDLGDLHDHYWSYITVILAGGYVETTKKGSYSRKPGYIGFKKAEDRHSLKLNDEKPAWTLIFVGPNKGAKSHGKYNKNSQKNQ